MTMEEVITEALSYDGLPPDKWQLEGIRDAVFAHARLASKLLPTENTNYRVAFIHVEYDDSREPVPHRLWLATTDALIAIEGFGTPVSTSHMLPLSHLNGIHDDH